MNDDDVLEPMHRRYAELYARLGLSLQQSAYVLLGLIVRHVSGMPFPQFLHDGIFAPLHMDSTVAYVKGESTVRARLRLHR